MGVKSIFVNEKKEGSLKSYSSESAIRFPKNPQKIKLFFSLLLVGFALDLNAQCNFKPIGHRGGSSYYFPENTLVSLEQGFIENIYAAEVDVRFTADSVLVLMHDSYIDRTTNGLGDVKNLSLAHIKSLDAGGWKDPMFAGTTVPTLREALELADKYQKKLYLNMKVFAPELIAKTLEEAQLTGDIILVDPDDLDKVAVYHKILPQTPQVYFGELPENFDDPGFYSILKNNGVVAIEIPADYIYNGNNDEFEELRDQAHANQLELWAYTVNDPAYFSFLKDFGIDGLETDRPSAAYQVFCKSAYGGHFPEKLITGQWDFNFNLFGSIGSQLVAMGDTTVENQKIEFGTTQSFGLPSIEDVSVNVAKIPAFDSKHALRFFSNIAPEGIPGGLDCDNTYSLIFDLLVPSGNNYYTAILQTSNNNSDDADFFLQGETNSFGILEQYNGSFSDSAWVRLALVFDLYNEKLDEYLNGELVGRILLNNSKNGRFCLNNNWGVQSSNFFSDNDGETNQLFVSSIQLRNYAMSANEIKELGGPKSAKIEKVILADSSIICPEFESDIIFTKTDGAVILNAPAGDSVNYKWEINKGNGWERIVGENYRNTASSALEILLPADSIDNFLFRCIAYNGCQTVSNEYVLENLNTGAKLGDKKTEAFTVYPNPSSGNIILDFYDSDELFMVKIYTIYGSEIFRKSFVQNKMVVNLAAGTYLIHIQNSTKSEVKKVLIYN